MSIRNFNTSDCNIEACQDSNDLEECKYSYCLNDRQTLQLLSISHDDFNQTAFIAGLTTALVVIALVIITIVGYICYRRRKQKQETNRVKKVNLQSILPLPSSPPPPPPTAVIINLPPMSEASLNNQQPRQTFIEYDNPDSPFIIGAQSLLIPHLDPPEPILTRRSLFVQPTTTIHDVSCLNRSSSVKVSKYDHQNIPACTISKPNIDDNDDDDELKWNKPKRAISIKKNNSTNSHASSVTRVASVNSQDLVFAKPKMVRINTITRKEGGITRKKSFRTEINDTEQGISLNDPPSIVENQSTMQNSNTPFLEEISRQ